MKLKSLIPLKGISTNLKAKDRRGVIEELVALLKKAYPTQKINAKDVAASVLQREVKLGSTGLGDGVAIPHARIDSVKDVLAIFGRTTSPIEFGAVDGEPVRLFFLIISPEARSKEYSAALEAVARSVKILNFCKFLKAAKTPKDIDEIFKDADVPVGV